MRILSLLAILVIALAVLTGPGEAHKAITSRFTYNADVYPIFRERCGRCHVAGGVGPMSLLSYQDAFPWAEALRGELLDAGTIQSKDFIRTAHRDISARDLDIVLDWATGGTPEGDPAHTPTAVHLQKEWLGGTPDLELPLPYPYHFQANVMEATAEFVLPVVASPGLQIAAIDLLPGTPAIVREVEISIRSMGGWSVESIGTWTPRQTPKPLTLKAVRRLAAGTELVVQIHYKKTWAYEGKAMTDRSTVGIYFHR